MKQIFSLLLSLCSLAALGQYPVSNINITMPPQPSANTANWATGFIITVQAKLVEGLKPGSLGESRILVTIKYGSAKICGAYTPQTAPVSNFNSTTKTWSGASATALLGQDCILKPGTYQVCVQFFSTLKSAGPLSAETCKFFTIGDNKIPENKTVENKLVDILKVTFSAPKNLKPDDGTVFSKDEVKNSFLFMWTPVQTKSKEDILYKIRMVELKAGQTKAQAIRTNKILFEKETSNQTQLSSGNDVVVIWPIALDSKYAWNVQAYLNGKLIGESEATTITFKKSDSDATIKEQNDTTDSAPPKNIQPVDGKNFTQQEAKQPIQLKWTQVLSPPQNRDIMYTVHIYAVGKGQTPVQAIRTNKTVFEKTVSTTQTTWQMPVEYTNSKETKTFVWNVRATKAGKAVGRNNGTSDPTSFDLRTANCVMTPTIIETSCISTTATSRTIRVKIKIENTSSAANPATVYMNHSNTFTHLLYSAMGLGPSNLIQPKNQSFMVSPGVNSVVPYNPTAYPSIINSGNFVFQEVDVNINNSITSFNLLVLTTSQGAGADDALVPCYEDLHIEPIPPCTCTYCDQFKTWIFSAGTLTATTTAPYTINLTTSITNPNLPIISFKAELVKFVHNSQEECIDCNKEDQSFGNFTGGTFGIWGNGVFPLYGSNTTHHTLSWFGLSGSTTALSSPINLTFTTPPFNPLKCCDDEIQFCIRYSFTDKECRTCSFVKCYTIKRKH